MGLFGRHACCAASIAAHRSIVEPDFESLPVRAFCPDW